MPRLMFREAIIAQLDRRKWTQYRLVQESGVSKTAVYDFLAGKRDLSSRNLERLCKSLGLVLKPDEKGA
ncbi:MAG: helix-turn-helix domain-containing protein [Phycisphaerae bacterium]|nr:helix-turn-helix transcriptional regulator [Phycisphaerae bacterium]MCZ2400125.1 helix-turn-helix domain-containing protein [Phycisphaerae bacterium]